MSSASCHLSPSLMKTSRKWLRVISSFSEASFPWPLKALTVSHPVNKCNSRREVHTSWPGTAGTLEMLRYLVRVPVPRFTYTLLCLSLWKARQRKMYLYLLYLNVCIFSYHDDGRYIRSCMFCVKDNSGVCFLLGCLQVVFFSNIITCESEAKVITCDIYSLTYIVYHPVFLACWTSSIGWQGSWSVLSY